MNDAKHTPLIWDFFKLITAVTITAAIAVVNVWYYPLIKYFDWRGTTLTAICVWLLLLPAFLAGLWGNQAIRKSHKATNKDPCVQACRFMNQTVWIIGLISLIPISNLAHPHPAVAMIPIFAVILSLPGSLLFYILVVLTTITAIILRGCYFLHLITVYCLLVAHFLFWQQAVAFIFYAT